MDKAAFEFSRFGFSCGRSRAPDIERVSVRTRETDVEPFVTLSELTEIELLILKRMREFTIGEHRSVFHGHGFDLVGLRDWAPGDRLNQVDWAQSTLTNFSPMVRS